MAKRTCSIEECERPYRTRGWCEMHYQRWRKRGDLTDPLARPKRTCAVEGCEEHAKGRGWCRKHYKRWLKHGDPARGLRTLEERFWSKVERSDSGCWIWTAGIASSSGYGRIQRSGQNRPQYAHRFAYELLVGPIPDGLTIDHVCHNVDPTCKGGECQHRRCVNPAHLEAVPIRVNILRSPNHLGNQTHCQRGHPFDEANTQRTEKGSRLCRTCRTQSIKRNNAKAASRA